MRLSDEFDKDKTQKKKKEILYSILETLVDIHVLTI